MDLLIEAVQALGLIVATVVVIFLVPLVFMLVFSLVSGFTERVPPAEEE